MGIRLLPFLIGLLNVRTLSSKSRQEELDRALTMVNFDVICLNEARIPGEGTVCLPLSSSTVFYSGGKHHRGVAFVVKNNLAQTAKFAAVFLIEWRY